MPASARSGSRTALDRWSNPRPARAAAVWPALLLCCHRRRREASVLPSPLPRCCHLRRAAATSALLTRRCPLPVIAATAALSPLPCCRVKNFRVGKRSNFTDPFFPQKGRKTPKLGLAVIRACAKKSSEFLIPFWEKTGQTTPYLQKVCFFMYQGNLQICLSIPLSSFFPLSVQGPMVPYPQAQLYWGLGLILCGALFYARVTFETLVVFNFKVP